MTDERISRSPNSPACPVCATGFAGEPGVTCPACRKAFAPRVALPIEPSFRRGIERFRFDGPAWFAGGLVLAYGLSQFVIWMGRFGVMLLILLLIPALLRTAKLFPRTRNDPAFFLFTTFVASLGVTILIAGVACAAGLVVMLVQEASGAGVGVRGLVFESGGGTAVVVFLVLFILFWPRRRAPSSHEYGED